VSLLPIEEKLIILSNIDRYVDKTISNNKGETVESIIAKKIKSLIKEKRKQYNESSSSSKRMRTNQP
jgi:hypothetical protein